MPITVSTGAVDDEAGAGHDEAEHDEVGSAAGDDVALTVAVAMAKPAKAVTSRVTMHDIDHHTLFVLLLRRLIFISESYCT